MSDAPICPFSHNWSFSVSSFSSVVNVNLSVIFKKIPTVIMTAGNVIIKDDMLYSVL